MDRNWDKLDFVLGSVHFLERADQMFDSVPDGVAQFEGKNIDEMYADYFRRLRELIASGLVDSCPPGSDQNPWTSADGRHRHAGE